MGNLSHISGNVGIGINTPTSLLHLYGSNPVLNIQNTAGSAGSGGEVVFGHDQTANTTPIASVKASLADGGGAGSRAGDLKFYTTNAGSLTEKMILTKDGRLGIGVASPTVALDVNGGVKVGDFGGDTNVLAKLNNSVPTENKPSVGCVVPLHAIAGGNNTIPLPAGTWFVYLTGTENNSSGDEDTQVVMAKVWTVSSSNFLRFKPTTFGTTVNTGISYSDSTSSAVNGSGTFTAIPLTDSYAAGSVAFSTVFAVGTHKGLVHSETNSGIDVINGFAIRIA